MDTTELHSQQGSQPDISIKLLESIRPSVFKIETSNGSGSGWLLDDNTIVTSYHVVKGARQITAVGQDGLRYHLGAEVAFDHEHDVAVLSFAGGVPRSRRPLARAENSYSLKAAQPLFSVGHAYGGSAKGVVGTYDHHATWKEWRRIEENSSPSVLVQIALAESEHKLSESQLSRPLLVSRIGTVPGCSGGPITNSDRQVVAMVTRGSSADPGLEYSTPIEKVNAVVNALHDPTKFSHRVGYREPGIHTLLRKADHDVLSFVGDVIGLSAGGYGASKLLKYDATMSATSRTGAIGGGLAGAAVLSYVGYNDADGFLRSSNSADTIKYGLALAADATMTSGFAARYLSILRSTGADRMGKAGKILLLSGLAARIACEFIPNNYVVDIGPKRIPM